LITVQVCMGSSCYIRGSAKVVETLRRLIERNGLLNKVVLKGSFCMERCTHGVTIKIDDSLFTGVHPEDIEQLFSREVLARIS